MGHREVIELAIRERRPVALEYRYPGQGMRTVHPHALFSSPAGEVVSAYQLDGYTASGEELPGWRSFDLDQIRGAELLDGRFEPAPGFNPDAPMYGGGIVAPS